MFESIHIEGYRGLESFDMSDLGRVNLLVGKNNCGKTSVLEAIYLLQTGGHPSALADVMGRRGERLGTQNKLFEIAHLFHGHNLNQGGAININAKASGHARSLTVSPGRITQQSLFGPDGETSLGLDLKGTPEPRFPFLPVSENGGIDVESMVRRTLFRAEEPLRAQFVGPESLRADHLIGLWDQIALTPAETLVMTALQTLDRRIERIAPLSGYGSTGSGRGGFIVKLKEIEQRIPIGSMGDGIWRMLALSIALSQCAGGVLFVDEIDTGLHYTAMSQMWSLVSKAAGELDVQVFATTHSYDCVFALADLEIGEVTVQRVEAGRGKAIRYSQEEIKVAARHEIEVR